MPAPLTPGRRLTPAQKQIRRRAKLAAAGQVDRTLVVPAALTDQAAELAAALCAWDAGEPPDLSDDTALLVEDLLRQRQQHRGADEAPERTA